MALVIFSTDTIIRITSRKRTTLAASLFSVVTFVSPSNSCALVRGRELKCDVHISWILFVVNTTIYGLCVTRE